MLASILVSLSSALVVAAQLAPLLPLPPIPPPSKELGTLASQARINYFDQLIDHNDPSLGTFQMRYWFDSTFYKAGGPIVLNTPGETSAVGFTDYLTNSTIIGQIAQELNGATIVIEHRYFGQSNPYSNLSVASLKYLTIEQALDDFAYFAQTVTLPSPVGDAAKPDQVPWVFVGGSYSGSLTAFLLDKKPDVFWAGYSSSGVVESILDFWRYFEPVREYMPANCSADVAAAIAHFDSIANDTDAFDALKTQFGMADVVHQDDVAEALRQPLFGWQDQQVYSPPNLPFYQFCDALEKDANGTIAPASGFGLDHTLKAWSSYYNNTYLPSMCGVQNREDCLGTYNPNSSYYTDIATGNVVRAWNWILCNEIAAFQDAAPADQVTLVSRLLQPSKNERQCQWMFPEAFASPPVPDVEKTNAVYGGWNLNVSRVFFATAHRDPWRDASMAAEGVTPPNIDPSNIGVSDGFHCSDLMTKSGTVDSTVLAVQKAGLAKISQWVGEFVPASSA